MNFTTLLEMINASEAREDDPDFQSPVDLMFERLEQKDPDHFAEMCIRDRSRPLRVAFIPPWLSFSTVRKASVNMRNG